MSDSPSVSVVRLAELLRETIRTRAFASPSAFTHEVLRNQEALANYECPDQGIQGSSLNTLKQHANAHLPGGFTALDKLRKTALEYRIKFDASSPSMEGSRTKAGLQRRIDELESTQERLDEDLLHISMAFQNAIEKARAIISESGRTDLTRRWADEERDLFAQASLIRTNLKPVS